MLSLQTTKSSSGISSSELLMKRKLQTLVPSPNVSINTNMKFKKPKVSQSGDFQSLKTSSTVRYCQNNNWTRNGMILNNNTMSKSYYTLLNDEDTVTGKNRSHLTKMKSNFIKIENGNDIDNDKETEPKTKHFIK